MSFSKDGHNRSYQREFLRAPYQEIVLLKVGEEVLKVKAKNISQGGLLIEKLEKPVEKNETLTLYLKVPYLPFFKSYTFDKLKEYSKDLFESKVISVECEVTRDNDEENLKNIGLKIVSTDAQSTQTIADYIDHFSSNLIYLQTLIQSLNSNPHKIDHIRELSFILGYDGDTKISLLSKKVDLDYRSLQWL